MKTIGRKENEGYRANLGSYTTYYPKHKFGTFRNAPLIITVGAGDLPALARYQDKQHAAYFLLLDEEAIRARSIRLGF